MICILQTADIWVNTGVVERGVESTTGDLSVYPVWYFLLPLAQTPGRRDRRLLVSPPKDTEINNL